MEWDGLGLGFLGSCRLLPWNCNPRIWLQSDNTVKEIRNGYSGRMLSSLLQHGSFRTATEAHLSVGHTHEDVDAVFSLCATALNGSPDPLQTPRNIQKILEGKLGPMFGKRGQRFSVDIVGVAAWFIQYKLL